MPADEDPSQDATEQSTQQEPHRQAPADQQAGRGQGHANPDGGQAAAQGGPAATPPVQQPAEPSYADLLTAPLTKRVARFAAIVYGALGAGLGLAFVALGTVGKPIFANGAHLDENGVQQLQEAGKLSAFRSQEFLNNAAEFALLLLPLLATAVAVALGAYAARNLDDGDRAVVVAAAVGALVGTVVLYVVAPFIVETQISSLTVDGSEWLESPGSVQFDALLLNGVAVGVGAALVSGATAWADRTQL
jgi:hypothetical protein